MKSRTNNEHVAAMSTNELKPVLESRNSDKQEWQEGVKKLMSKVAMLRESGVDLYLDDPKNFKSNLRNKTP